MKVYCRRVMTGGPALLGVMSMVYNENQVARTFGTHLMQALNEPAYPVWVSVVGVSLIAVAFAHQRRDERRYQPAGTPHRDDTGPAHHDGRRYGAPRPSRDRVPRQSRRWAGHAVCQCSCGSVVGNSCIRRNPLRGSCIRLPDRWRRCIRVTCQRFRRWLLRGQHSRPCVLAPTRPAKAPRRPAGSRQPSRTASAGPA